MSEEYSYFFKGITCSETLIIKNLCFGPRFLPRNLDYVAEKMPSHQKLSLKILFIAPLDVLQLGKVWKVTGM